MAFGIEGKTSLSLEARNRDYVEVEDSAAAVSRRLSRLTAIMREMRLFAR